MINHLALALACWMCVLTVFCLSEHYTVRSIRVIIIIIIIIIIKGKAVPLQAWSGPEDSRKLRFPALCTGHLYPQEMLLVLISVKG